ncbi:transcriptional regulator [Rhizomonospora bruguierae]|uniref:transcriptional regulator n=1 Tax=Rhizomonospora bruguierae TaxID=1581705 RepID=UPI001BCC9E32|nr:transcriptional regulator [Micromonospora sp. NBRC 107566]
MSEPDGFNRIIHSAGRLRVCAALSAAAEVEFSVLQNNVGLSASALSKQVHVLLDAGYVSQQRDPVDSRRIWLSLTGAGQAAYRGHLAALHAITGTDPTRQG